MVTITIRFAKGQQMVEQLFWFKSIQMLITLNTFPKCKYLKQNVPIVRSPYIVEYSFEGIRSSKVILTPA